MKDLNFFSSYSKKKDISLSKERVFYFILALSIFSMLSYEIYNYIAIRKLNGYINSIVKQIEETNRDNRIEELKKKEIEVSRIKTNLAKLKVLDDHISKKYIVNEHLLDDIENNLPPKVFLKSMELNYNEIKILGKSADKESIAQFEHNLNELGVFAEVFIPQIIQYEDYLDFSIDIKFGEGKSHGAEAEKH